MSVFGTTTSNYERKYYDLYSSSVFTGTYSTNIDLCTLETCGGHALYEIKNWYNDYNYFTYSSNIWFKRGGNNENKDGAGIFSSYYHSATSVNQMSWRLTITPEN